MGIRTFIISAAAYILYTIPSHASVPDGFIQINNNTGLSNSSVTSIFQDSDDVMWFGTWNGLNRYDGASIIQYHPQATEKNSISHQVIRSIAEDSRGYLWVATDFGINRMDRTDGSFDAFFLGYDRPYIYEEGIFSCTISAGGTVAAARKGGQISVFDYESGNFRLLEGCEGLTVTAVLFFDAYGRLWVLTEDNTVARMSVSKGHASDIAVTDMPALHGRLHFDGYDRIWHQSGEKLYCMDIYDPDPEMADSGLKIRSTLNSIRNMDGEIFLCTTGGCYVSGKWTGLERLTEEEIPVWSVFKGSQNILWLGTDGKGVLKEKYRPEFISALDRQVGRKFPVRAIAIDRKGTVYIGSKGGGLSILPTGGGIFHNLDVGPGKTYNSVLALEISGERVYVGTDGDGLLYMDSADGRLRKVVMPENRGVLPGSVYAISAQNDTLWLGTSGKGLFRVVMDGSRAVSVENFRHSDSDPESIGSNIIYDLVDDGRYLWMATRGGGLNRFDKVSGKAEIFMAENGGDGFVCSNDVISLLLDSRGRLWVGTSSGLCCICDEASRIPENDGRDIRYFDEASGLPNADIHSILEASDGSIWVSTDKGVARIGGDEPVISSWTYEDGLSNNEFSDGAGFSYDDGRKLYFGSVSGVDVIDPSLVTGESFVPKLSLKSVEVDNTEYFPEGNVISTDYRTGSVTLEFSLPDYVSEEKNSISYFLRKGRGKGHDAIGDHKWIDIGSSRQIVVGRLRPGKYTLWVRGPGAVPDGTDIQADSSTLMTFHLNVAWPVLLKPWLIFIYACIMLGVAVTLFLLHRSRKAIFEELEKEKRENALKEEIVQAKFRFFTNIAHEFSNSITLIFGAVEQIFGMGSGTGGRNAANTKQLMAIRSNADRMHRQIQELMEFSKADSGHLPVVYEKVDVAELLKYTSDNFIDIAETKKIRLTFHVQAGLAQWVTDRSMLEKIVFNLLSNAMKYTPDEGWIEISAGTGTVGDLVISVRNSGPGIARDKLADIFDRYVILDNFETKLSHGHYTRTGIGLALCKDLTGILGGKITADSQENVFTDFTVALPWKDESNIGRTSGSGPEEDDMAETALIHENATVEKAEERSVIMIVDDYQDIRALIADILSDEYDTVEAGDGESAVRLLETVSPALIICDMIMPGMGGIEFVKKVKGDAGSKDIPVVMLSCDSDIENRVNAINTGADMFIVKPFHPRYLKAVVERILESRAGHVVPEEDSATAKEDVRHACRSGAWPCPGGGEDSHDAAGTAGKGMSPFARKVNEALLKNFSDETYNQDALAYDLAMSRVQLYRRVKGELKTTPGELIKRFRIHQAEIMLRETEKTVQEIMYDCGFHNKAYFYREFSRIHNCSPKDFRHRG